LDSDKRNKKTYQAINELVTTLSKEKSTIYGDIFRSVYLPISAFENFCSWSSESYTRNCLFENEKFELILLCWEGSQGTAIHDHGGEECWVRVIQGEFKETIYKLDEAGELQIVKSHLAKKGDISYMIDFMGCHRLENQSDGRSMSLHLYAKPIRHCNLFDESCGKFIHKDLFYNTTSKIITNSED